MPYSLLLVVVSALVIVFISPFVTVYAWQRSRHMKSWVACLWISLIATIPLLRITELSVWWAVAALACSAGITLGLAAHLRGRRPKHTSVFGDLTWENPE